MNNKELALIGILVITVLYLVIHIITMPVSIEQPETHVFIHTDYNHSTPIPEHPTSSPTVTPTIPTASTATSSTATISSTPKVTPTVTSKVTPIDIDDDNVVFHLEGTYDIENCQSI